MDEKQSDPERGRNAITVHERSANSSKSSRIPKAQKRKLLQYEIETCRIHSSSSQSPSPSSSSSLILYYNSTDSSHGCCKFHLNCPDSTRHNNIQPSVLAKRKNSHRKDDMMEKAAKSKQIFSPHEQDDEKFLQKACTDSGYGRKLDLDCLNRYDNILSLLAKRKEEMTEIGAKSKQICSADEEDDEKFLQNDCTDFGYGGKLDSDCLNRYDNILSLTEKMTKLKQICPPNEEDDEKFEQEACKDSDYGDEVYNLSCLHKKMKEKVKKKAIFSPNEEEDDKFLQKACTDSVSRDEVYNLSCLNENMTEKVKEKQIYSQNEKDDNEDEKFLQKACTDSGSGDEIYNLSCLNGNMTEKAQIYSCNEEQNNEDEKFLQKACRDPGYGGKLSFDLSLLAKRIKCSTHKQRLSPEDEAILKACEDSGYGRKVELNLPYMRRIPAVFLMLNRDFIVASPVKQNLLLTLSLLKSGRNRKLALKSENESRRQILVGRFTPFRSFLHFQLGRDASRVRTVSNAGGSSTISEAGDSNSFTSLSVEYFVRRFQATDIVTEMEVEYCSLNWKKVDYICTLYGKRVGVSVTRAMSYPDPKDFNAQMAHRLLYKKLFGLVVARHGVTKRHNFSQCILHIWCETEETAKILEKEYEGVSMDLDIADDVIMVLTVAEGWHSRPIFYESILK